MGDIYTNPPQSRNEAILRATIDGTEYEAPPQSRMEDLLVELKAAIEQGGGTGSYNGLSNKPQINSVTLQGDKSISDLFDGKVDIGVDTVEESGYAELKDENGDRIFRASSANGGASVESGALIGQPGALVLYNGEGGLGSVRPKGGVSLVDVDLPAENGTLALDSQIASSQTPAKAAVVTVTDAAPINAEDITVDITPQQDLHGYDRPWAGGAWKNKLNYIDFKGIQGGTVTKSNGTLTITGTNARTGANITDKLVNYLPAGTYTLSFTVTSITNYQNQPTFFGFIVKKSGGAYVYSSVSVSQTGTKSLTYTLSEGDRFDRIDFNINDQSSALSNACTFEIKDIQIEAGNQATSYADYENICPIEGRTGAELDRVGKNWLPLPAEQTINGVTLTYLSDGGIKLTGTPTANAYFDCFDGTFDSTAYAGYRFIASYIGPSGGILFRISKSNRVGIQDLYSNTIIADNGSGLYLALRVALDAVIPSSGIVIYPMLLPPSEANYDFEPYQGQQYTASFGETVHGGKWHVTEGGTDKTLKNVEYSDNTGIERNNGTQYFCDVSTLGIPMGYLLSNKFKPITDASEQNDPGVCYINANGKIRFNTAKSYDSVTEMITDIGTIQFSYELATPTTISTPKQNVPMLKGINTVSADCGDTQLKYQPDNVIGELKGEIQEVESELDKLDKADMAFDYFSEMGINGEYQITRIGNEIHVAAVIDDASIATQTGSVDLIADLPDDFKCNPSYEAVFALRHSSGTGKIEFKLSADITPSFLMHVEEVNTTSGVWFPIYDVPGKAL